MSKRRPLAVRLVPAAVALILAAGYASSGLGDPAGDSRASGASGRAAAAEPTPAKSSADLEARVAAVRARAQRRNYEEARWDPLHFEPAIGEASDAECLVCHQEILDKGVLARSPAGVAAETALAWYQTLDTYDGPQESFHRRHILTPYAREVMNLSCNFCHRGNDLREEAPSTLLEQGLTQVRDGRPAFALRKVVEPTEACLRCHGAFNWEVMQLPGPWHEVRADLETEDAPNGCLSCHAGLFRTVRHQVTYLHPERIEELAQTSSDVCYGCHGSRRWYRIAYPYPRHPWPGMDPEVPEWAKDRPTESEPRFRIAR